MGRCLSAWWGIACVIACVSGFNVHLDSHVTHFSDQRESLFGFAVAQHMDNGQARLLVGAPLYDTEQAALGVSKAGAVLSCDPNIANRCTYIPFDRNGNNVHLLGQKVEDKSGQWFGATVKSSGPDGIVVACAPRYVWFAENLERRDPIGTCFVARRALTDFTEYSPCRTRNWGYHQQGSCQAGFDAGITEDGSRLYIGSPGAYYWQGQIHSYNTVKRNEYIKTREGPEEYDDQYFGYSLAVGDFNGDGEEDVAIGVPKGLNYTGKVALLTDRLRPIQNITGYQLGSYFGYCLAVLDFNNDGLDDVVIGAPLYTNYEDREMKFEVGRVHVVLQNRLHRFRQVVTLTGEVSQGRFGLSLTPLGDINKDGIQDMAVGAPYGGLDGNGAVFIYHGFEIKSGELIAEDLKKPSQVIFAEDVGLGVPMASFGWALSGGIDVDYNDYPDLLVGATHAGAAVVLKSRPIVSLVNHSLTFLGEDEIDVEVLSSALTDKDKQCITRSGRQVSCVDLEFCVGYGGVAVPDDIALEVKYQLDGQVKDPRLFFMTTDKQGFSETLRLTRDKVTCTTHQTYVSPSLTDKLTPLGAEVRLALVEDHSASLTLPHAVIPPILNMKQKLNLSSTINIKNNCGADDLCEPDLQLTFEAPDTFTFGKKEQLDVSVRVMNHGEDAYQAKVFIPEPPGLQYNIFEARDNTSVTCSPRYHSNSTVLVCDIGNPLNRLTGVHFAVFFHPQSSTLTDDRIEFELVANSTIKEANSKRDDNFIKKTIMLNADVDLALYGSSMPENIGYNASLYRTSNYRHEEHIGPEILHTFALSNNGVSKLTETEFVILWPLRAMNGESYLLYLLEQPYVTGPGSCSFVPDTNPLQLELNKETSTTKLLRLQGEKREKEGRVAVGGEGGRVEVEERYSEERREGGGGGGATLEGEVEREREVKSGGGKKTTYYEETSFTKYTTGGEGGRGSGGGNYSTSSSTYSSSSSSSRTFSSSSSSSSSSSYGSSSSNYRRRRRKIREVDSAQDWDSLINNCGITDCIKIHCTAGPLEEQDIVFVYVRSRLFLTTLKEESLYPYDDVTITSRLVARATSLPYGVNPDNIPVKTLDVTTPVSPAKSLDEARGVPWWVIILAVLAGILILLLIILILWKCGYFKRHRPETSGRGGGGGGDDAHQPLNPPKNGTTTTKTHTSHHHYNRPLFPGDEAL